MLGLEYKAASVAEASIFNGPQASTLPNGRILKDHRILHICRCPRDNELVVRGGRNSVVGRKALKYMQG
jgi:hypothetical protein